MRAFTTRSYSPPPPPRPVSRSPRVFSAPVRHAPSNLSNFRGLKFVSRFLGGGGDVTRIYRFIRYPSQAVAAESRRRSGIDRDDAHPRSLPHAQTLRTAQTEKRRYRCLRARASCDRRRRYTRVTFARVRYRAVGKGGGGLMRRRCDDDVSLSPDVCRRISRFSPESLTLGREGTGTTDRAFDERRAVTSDAEKRADEEGGGLRDSYARASKIPTRIPREGRIHPVANCVLPTYLFPPPTSPVQYLPRRRDSRAFL